jgi:hypothetical protein
MTKIDKQDIEAFIDSQLSNKDELLILDFLRQDPVMENYYYKLLSQKNILRIWWKQEQKKHH